MNETKVFDREEDEFLNELLTDDTALEYWANDVIDSSSSTGTNSLLSEDNDYHHVIYVNKRKYQRKTERLERTHIKVPNEKNFHITFPRILKNDIRRKYMLMYANVMNSFNYHLITSFCEQFLVPSVQLVKYHPFSLPQVLLRGVNPIMSYFLLLLQMCPDTVTNISDIQLEQSLADMERTQVSCKFNVKNTRLYDLSPVHFLATLEDDLKQLTINDQNISPTETGQGEDELIGMKERKRKLDSRKIEKMEKHKFLFDPISGIFLQSRFQRSEALIQNSLDGSLTFVLDRNKRIESIIISPKEKVQLPQKEV